MLFGKFFSLEPPLENPNINPMKILVYKKEQLTNVPRFLTVAINYVRTLKFEEEPDYQYIIRIFTELLSEQRKLDGYNEENDEGLEEDEYEWS
jgi:hypothetical protein